MTDPRIGVIIQARMGSSRFPRKVLHRVAGKPMIEYLLERLEHGTPRETVLATSVSTDDDALADFCRSRGLTCFRGDLEDVAARFLSVLDAHSFDAFVRVNGDSPLLDAAVVDEAVSLYTTGRHDVVTNILQRSFPKGQSVEVVSAAAYRRACADMVPGDEHEHLTRHFYRNASRYRIHNFTSGSDFGAVQLSVDSVDDMARFERIVSLMDRPHWTYGWREVLELSRRSASGSGR